MGHFYKLLNHEFSRLFPSLAILYFGVMASPFILLNIAAKKSVYPSMRFEDLYAASGCIMVFVVLLAALFGIYIKSIYSDYWGSKSIYTLLTLPVKREYVYLSRLTAFFIAAAGFISVQLISYILAYQFYMPEIRYIQNGIFALRKMHNGLFLSLIRSDFMRFMLPIGFESILSSLASIIAMICAIYYGALCERSGRYWGFMLIAPAAVFMIYMLSYKLQALYYRNYIGMYPYSVMLLLLSGFFIWHSIKLIKSSAIA